jgi:hypothetical protein
MPVASRRKGRGVFCGGTGGHQAGRGIDHDTAPGGVDYWDQLLDQRDHRHGPVRLGYLQQILARPLDQVLHDSHGRPIGQFDCRAPQLGGIPGAVLLIRVDRGYQVGPAQRLGRVPVADLVEAGDAGAEGS